MASSKSEVVQDSGSVAAGFGFFFAAVEAFFFLAGSTVDSAGAVMVSPHLGH